MKSALFVNFTDEDFTHSWDGEYRTFKAQTSVRMEDWMAKHFAKHLVNRELQTNVPKGDTHTSPKFPEQDPIFMGLFRKAYIEEGEEMSAQDVKLAVLNKKVKTPSERLEEIEEEEKPKPAKKGKAKTVVVEHDEVEFADLEEEA